MQPPTLSAAEAAERLGVKLETIYAYVSRGLLQRIAGPDKESRFALEQVERGERASPAEVEAAFARFRK